MIDKLKMNLIIICKNASIISLVVFSVVAIGTTPKSDKFIKKVPKLDSVSGEAVGFAGTPGEFYQIAQKLNTQVSKKQILELVKSKNVMSRAMGLWLIANSKLEDKDKILKSYQSDTSLLVLRYSGCVGNGAKLGDFVKDLIKNPRVLSISKAN